MKKLLAEIRQCNICEPHLTNGVNPVLNASAKSKIVIIGQAPGIRVHNSGVPWQDKSGENLRAWLDVDEKTFYNPDYFAILPMGFRYPGKGKSGDLPPRKECAPKWHPDVLKKLKNVKLTLLIGQYAQGYYLGDRSERTLTATVKNFKEYLPDYFVLPHPSPRNNIWQAKNPWFKKDVLPAFKNLTKNIC